MIDLQKISIQMQWLIPPSQQRPFQSSRSPSGRESPSCWPDRRLSRTSTHVPDRLSKQLSDRATRKLKATSHWSFPISYWPFKINQLSKKTTTIIYYVDRGVRATRFLFNMLRQAAQLGAVGHFLNRDACRMVDIIQKVSSVFTRCKRVPTLHKRLTIFQRELNM